MTIDQLRCFSVAARMENLSAAAAALYITQSSLSKKISSLEKELGVQLFDRKGKTLRLNEAGDFFSECCRKLLGDFDTSVDKLRRMDRKKNTRIRIGLEGDPGTLIPCMAEFRKDHPDVTYDIDSSLAEQEHPDINEYDVMIYPDARKYRKYSGYPYFTERYCLAVPEGNPLSGQKNISNRSLNGSALVFVRQKESVYEYPYEICRSLMLESITEHIVDSESLKRKMITEGIACGFVSSENEDFYMNVPGIRLIPLVSSRFERQMMICFRRRKHLTEAAAEFVSYLSRSAGIPEEQ